jgi:hypothetical protein
LLVKTRGVDKHRDDGHYVGVVGHGEVRFAVSVDVGVRQAAGDLRCRVLRNDGVIRMHGT